ncbi:MAG: carbonic anhydrase family protein [Candidatus Acidiferrales bacterium]
MRHPIARRSPSILSISTFAFLAAIIVAPAAFAQATAATHAPHWGYSGADGPSHWADLDPSFATCKTGKRQSPLDIKGAKKDSSLAPVQIDYKPSPLKIVDNGHTIRVNVPPGSSITVNGVAYTLTQFHFHRPSEEEIAGKKYAMVIHLVNERAGGAAVIALLVKAGAENPTVQKIWDNIPKEKDKENEVAGVTINAADLLPADQNYYNFDGSLTTPPCSEGVKWFVMKTPVEMSAAQIAAFAKLYPMNARPIQPTNGREIKESAFTISK